MATMWKTPFDVASSILSAVLPKRVGPTHAILHNSTGLLKPGEMCLVLGTPGSGCTTFLKTIANHREEFAKVEGDVLYAGFEADVMEKLYKGEVVYNGEGMCSSFLMYRGGFNSKIRRRHSHSHLDSRSDSRLRIVH